MPWIYEPSGILGAHPWLFVFGGVILGFSLGLIMTIFFYHNKPPTPPVNHDLEASTEIGSVYESMSRRPSIDHNTLPHVEMALIKAQSLGLIKAN
eukprot:gene9565-12132_t